MLIRIDAQSPEPIFEQIAFQVKGAVARGLLAAGDKLPSVRELAKEISINPNTVFRAYDTLEKEGILVRRQGAGCFVTDKKSTLSEEERLRRLEDLMRRLVTEAYHLGFEPEQVAVLLERESQWVQSTEKGKRRHELIH